MENSAPSFQIFLTKFSTSALYNCGNKNRRQNPVWKFTKTIIPFALVGYEVIITNLRYALVGYFITSYPARAHGIIVICYIPTLSLSKMSTVIGWFLITCLWSNSNVSRPGYNCAVVALTKSLLVCFCYMKVQIYNKALNVWSLGKLVSSFFPRVLMFSSTSSRETSGLSGKKTNCFPRDHTLSVYYSPPTEWIMRKPNKNKMTSVNSSFASVSESEILKIQVYAVPENTKKATKFGMKVFRGRRRLNILQTSVLPFIILDAT